MQFKYYNNIVPESFPSLLDDWSFKQSSQHSILVSKYSKYFQKDFYLLSFNENAIITLMTFIKPAVCNSISFHLFC
jgi:hypothetical protein